jgi:hypothetical protein
MEPPVRLVEALFGPAAPYIPSVKWPAELSDQRSTCLNHEKLDDSTAEIKPTRWRFFGADIFESRLFIVPDFAIDKAPAQIDVYLGDDVDLESPLCRALGASVTAFARNDSLGSLPFIRHIIRALQCWSDGREDFENAYLNLPFGSLILIENLAAEVSATPIRMVALYDMENQWLSMRVLRDMWKLPDSQWPTTVDVAELRFDRRLHSTIALVSVPAYFDNQLFAFKSSVRDVRYMYHELRLLLSQEAHPNVISQPILIVTKQCKFGGKRGICGFLLEYHPLGTLRSALRPGSPQSTEISMNTRARWALQIASALVHIVKSPAGYFSDLKLDNVVLQKQGNEYNAVLIDFEQRGAWFSWSPPEINHIVCLVYLANIGTKFGLLATVSQRYKALLQECLPTWREVSDTKQYENGRDGYNQAWMSLTPPEQEKATVFMFGKVLWCLFEEQSTTNSATFFGAEIFREVNPQYRFPDFRQTPDIIRDLIKQCTIGAPELKGQKAVLYRVGDKVYPAGASDGLTKTDATREETQDVARKWWKNQVDAAEAYLREMHASPSICSILNEAKKRPSFEQIHAVLAQYCCEAQSTT